MTSEYCWHCEQKNKRIRELEQLAEARWEMVKVSQQASIKDHNRNIELESENERVRREIGDVNERLEAAQENLDYNRNQLKVAEAALKRYADKLNWNPVQVSCDGVNGPQFEIWCGTPRGWSVAESYFEKNAMRKDHLIYKGDKMMQGRIRELEQENATNFSLYKSWYHRCLKAEADLKDEAKKVLKNDATMDEIRRAVADYIWSEGCSCCQDYDRHKEAAARLAGLLNVPPYSDGSGHEFSKFRTNEKRKMR